jgi:hypothetical protein
MNDELRVTYIRYVFYGSALLEGQENANRFESEESARKFADLCHDELEQKYPGVEIEILDAEIDRDLPSQVIAVDEQSKKGLREIELPDELQRVEEICEHEVYEKRKWLVVRRWENIIEVREALPRIPSISVIDWACQEGLIEESECQEGIWEFPWDKWIDWVDVISENPVVELCNGVFGACVAGDEISNDFQCYNSEILRCSLADLPLEIEVLFPVPESFTQSLIETDNSSVKISFYGEDVSIEIARFNDGSHWPYPWSFDFFAQTIVGRAQERNIEAVAHNMGFRLIFRFQPSQIETLNDMILDVSDIFGHLIQESEKHLAGKPVWKALYERNEEAFCKQILRPLLKKMGFSHVRYTHGRHEHGRDFVFREQTRFGEVRYCALQAKAGDVSGGASSQVDQIFRQIKLGFKRPFKGLEEEKYISEFVVAISGHFTNDAEEAIRTELRMFNNRGSVYFWDKKKILDLIGRYYEDKS